MGFNGVTKSQGATMGVSGVTKVPGGHTVVL